MRNIMLTIAYDGTNYGGWQRQKNSVTVQEKVEDALISVLEPNAPVRLTSASRTDAGVHAACQRACFLTERIAVPAERLPLALNPALPRDISIQRAEEMPLEFHPRYHAKQKEYRYNILNGKYPLPIFKNHAWHIHGALNTDKMNSAAAYFHGTHDFSAFCAASATARTRSRTIYECKIEEKPIYDINESRLITISVKGDGFLYNMVRIIAGTLIYVGCGKTVPDDIPGIIARKDRSAAGITAPPHGLVLWRIDY